MNINFKYNDSLNHELSATSDDNAEISIIFDNELTPSYVYLNGHEMEVASDDSEGIYLCFDKKIMLVDSIVKYAESVLEEYIQDHINETQEEDNYRQEVSSPYYTGRV